MNHHKVLRDLDTLLRLASVDKRTSDHTIQLVSLIANLRLEVLSDQAAQNQVAVDKLPMPEEGKLPPMRKKHPDLNPDTDYGWALSQPCPSCGAKPGKPCVVIRQRGNGLPAGAVLGSAHPEVGPQYHKPRTEAGREARRKAKDDRDS